MIDDIITFLGMNLEELVKSPQFLSLNERVRTDLIHNRFHMVLRKSGIEIIAGLDGRVRNIQMHAENHEGFNAFMGVLPERLAFSNSRQAIHARLGEPSIHGGGIVVEFLGMIPFWDRYDRTSYSLHIEYDNSSKSVCAISIMRPDAMPK